MKFAREYRSILETEGFPPRWVESAVPYAQLKKCLKKVQLELQKPGLDQVISRYSLYSADKEFQTSFELSTVDQGSQSQNRSPKQVPKLSNLVLLQDSAVSDISPCSNATAYLQSLICESLNQKNFLKKHRTNEEVYSQDPRNPLVFHVDFFDILREDVASLERLQAQEQESLGSQIEALSAAVMALTKPSKLRKTDMYRWRELFDIYMQADIFFSNHEYDRGDRDSKTAAKQLRWFQTELLRRGLENMFKLSASREALNHFVSINISLLQILKFQEINQKAISKILKKFSKRTSLNTGSFFPRLILSDAVMLRSIAKTVCSKVTKDLVQIVPQLDDYLCSICFAIVWLPIRMRCRHFFCIECTIVLQKQKNRLCPLCRESVVMEVNQDNIDRELAIFLKKYFPKEVKTKQVSNETSAGIERYGVYYKHPSKERCCIM